MVVEETIHIEIPEVLRKSGISPLRMCHAEKEVILVHRYSLDPQKEAVRDLFMDVVGCYLFSSERMDSLISYVLLELYKSLSSSINRSDSIQLLMCLWQSPLIEQFRVRLESVIVLFESK